MFRIFLLFTFVFFVSNSFAQPEIDTTFGGTGKFVIEFGAIGGISKVLFQPDNKLIHVGYCTHIGFGSSVFCAVRLNEDGSMDSSFGNPQTNPGFVIPQVPGMNFDGAAGGAGAEFQRSGKIVSAGYGVSGPPGSDAQMVLVRLNTDGSFDNTFGNGNGIVNSPIAGYTRAFGMVVQPDDKILVVGTKNSSYPYTQFVVRFNPNGSVDSTFGNNGVVMIMPAGYESTIGFSINLRQDGRMITGGSALGTGQQSSLMLTRLNKDGSLDTTFDGDGYKLEPYEVGGDPLPGFRTILFQSDGRLLVRHPRNLLYRYNDDGSLDTSFDSDGWRPALPSPATALGYTVSASGKITVVGYIPPPSFVYDYQVARYLPNGAPDTSFSGDGLLQIDVNARNDAATAVGTDLKGRLVIGAYSGGDLQGNPFSNPKFSNARLMASPTQNVGFSGRVTDSDGKPIYNASITLIKDSETVAVARTNPFGYFNFNNIPTNQNYLLSTRAKNLNFNDQNVLVDDQITNFLIIARQ